ncbi:universal stress protein [Streptacidiphilus rugosus]|uniref:universal stress protein n=1 Tax=Streptacidiphilus rugosus TaxID=405783 RepID=UPI00056AEA27|nr:universal stress protein [Streptacidiphilus rugosus]
MFRHILLALDSSPARDRLVKTAACLAGPSRGTVHVLHIDATAAAGTGAVALEDQLTARQVLDQALRTLHEQGVPADGELLDGFITDIPALISNTAERHGADLLILGPHHRGLFASLFNPRVSDAVSHTARTPVLLIPDNEASAA